MLALTLTILTAVPSHAATVYKNTLVPSSVKTVTETTHAADPYGNWRWSENGWWWQNGDGTYPKNTWAWLDGNKDGLAECYYFDENGWMVHDTVTANGFTLNTDGQWTLNGVVYRKEWKNIVSNNYQILQSYSDEKLSDVVTNIITITSSNSSSSSTTSSSSEKEEMTVSEYKEFLDSISSLSKSAQTKALDILKSNYKIVSD